jgi:hypothetical protein
MVSLVMQEARKCCGGDMTESKRLVESMKNAIQKVAPRLTKDCSVGFMEFGQGNHQPQSVGILTKSTPKFFLWASSMAVLT